MGDIRLTIIDDEETISFVGPGHGAKVLTAACSHRPTRLGAMLEGAKPFDPEMIDYLLDGLAHFDEHNGPGRYDAIHRALATSEPGAAPPFRVVDEVTRAASLTPVRTGLILYNLPAQRIVQVQNSYSAIQRKDRGRVRASGRPTRHLYRYELPNDWRIVP